MQPLVDIVFTADVIYWRGPSPFHFIAVPPEHVGEVSFAARRVSYGWGMVPAKVEIGGHAFTTALFAKDDTYVVPLKDAVRRETGVTLGDRVAVALTIGEPER